MIYSVIQIRFCSVVHNDTQLLPNICRQNKASNRFFFSPLVSEVAITLRTIKTQICFQKGNEHVSGSLYSIQELNRSSFTSSNSFGNRLIFAFISRTTRMLLHFWWKVTDWSIVFPKWSGPRELWPWHLGYKKNA